MAKRHEAFDPSALVRPDDPRSAAAMKGKVAAMRGDEGLPTRQFLAENGISVIRNADMRRSTNDRELPDETNKRQIVEPIGEYTAGPELTSPVEKALDDAAGQKVTVVWLEPTDPAR